MILEKVNEFNESEVSTKFVKYGVKNRKHLTSLINHMGLSLMSSKDEAITDTDK